MSTEEKDRKTSRRQFLKGAALVSVGGMAAGVSACTNAATTAPAAPAATCPPAAARPPAATCPPAAACPPAPACATAVPCGPTAPVIKWDKEADVVVIGTGFAGLSAAITVAEGGGKVIIIEKMKQAQEGGNSRVSGNMFWLPDDVATGIKYAKGMAIGLTDDESITALMTEMGKMKEFVTGLGVDVKPLGIFQPEHPQIAGSETVKTYNNGGVTGDGVFWQPFRDRVTKLGIEVLYETPATELVQNPLSKDILGVKAKSAGKDIFIKGKKGVFMGCGGFEFDYEMEKQYLPAWPVYSRGSTANTGDGIRMVQRVGAQLWHMNNALAGIGCMIIKDFDPIPVPVSFGAQNYILVDKAGKRFMSENRANRHGFGHKEYLFQFDGVIGDFMMLPCWAVIDEAVIKKASIAGNTTRKFGWFGWFGGYNWSADNQKEIDKGYIIKANTVADLAKAIKVDEKVLAATLEKYNKDAAAGVDTAFDRPKANLLPIDTTKPLYAVALYPVMYNTQGGAKRNAKCQILDADNKPIAHLYSGGEFGSFWGWMYNGGGNVSEAICTGRIAGRGLLAEKALA